MPTVTVGATLLHGTCPYKDPSAPRDTEKAAPVTQAAGLPGHRVPPLDVGRPASRTVRNDALWFTNQGLRYFLIAAHAFWDSHLVK